MHQPERTCVGCRGRDPKRDLLRLVQAPTSGPGTTIQVDDQQAASGRGAYLHQLRSCLDLAVRRRALGRALRTSTPDAEQVRQAVNPHLEPDDGTA